MKKRIIILLQLFVGFYIFLLSAAADMEFAPCEVFRIGRLEFIYASPIILSLLISIITYNFIIRRSGKPLKDYLKALSFSVFGLVLCVFFALHLTGFVWSFLEHNYYNTEIYWNLFEIRCGCDGDTFKTLPFSLLMSIGTIIAGSVLWGLVSLIQLLKTRVKIKSQ